MMAMCKAVGAEMIFDCPIEVRSCETQTEECGLFVTDECYDVLVDHVTDKEANLTSGVIDTACQRGCGGDRTIDGFVQAVQVATSSQPSNILFKGVNQAAPVKAASQDTIPVGIGGHGIMLKLQRLPNSDVPLLISRPI